MAVAGAVVLGPPGAAQLPTLPPFLGGSSTTTTTAPGSTTTSTVILPIEEVLKPTPTTVAGGPTTAPPSSILPLPTPPPTRKTTTYKPPPVPPSSPAKALAGPGKTPGTTAPPRRAGSADESEAGEGDTGFEAQLPFDTSSGEFVSGDDATMELGIHAEAADDIKPYASVAAALLAFVLFGIALILRSEVRKRPAYAGGGDWRRRNTDLYDWTYDEDH